MRSFAKYHALKFFIWSSEGRLYFLRFICVIMNALKSFFIKLSYKLLSSYPSKKQVYPIIQSVIHEDFLTFFKRVQYWKVFELLKKKVLQQQPHMSYHYLELDQVSRLHFQLHTNLKLHFDKLDWYLQSHISLIMVSSSSTWSNHKKRLMLEYSRLHMIQSLYTYFLARCYIQTE